MAETIVIPSNQPTEGILNTTDYGISLECAK